MSKNIIEELKWRGLTKQITSEERILEAEKEHSGVYCGFDPTADSLHVGHLIPITLLKRFQDFGFNPIALIGGGTGMIGDPSFKSQERVLQTNEQVKENSDAITKQLKGIIPGVDFANNYEWLGKLSLLDFLRDVGKEYTLGYLLAKESIATRIETGLSVTEFMYTILQGYDFYQLYVNKNCHIQVGGSDQWGNITSGTDLIGSKVGRDKTKAAGLTINLLTKKDGKKFGKTESGAVWLDANKTSVYEFYQFWFNQDDEDAYRMLKFFTFLTEDEINILQKQAIGDPKARIMQHKLAEEMTAFVHGKDGLQQALNITNGFFQGSLKDLSDKEIEVAFKAIPNGEITENETLIDVLVASKAASSKREAREFLNAGAITINDEVLKDENLAITKAFALDNKHVIIKRGKRKFFGAEFK
ncbi:tyrosine--tRNA ligase [Mesoplasma lactucae]|uniref:Tyrosine--tRNA ligase n=1 Tax=Mesoplasma lactucae ATCC 49193 TaxID=81460 RepID=A0A291IS39_9MOLU|nr:tyrosine--tRNA ligase [Mesoplasma lactucae]ATG97564.1 tyrosine--tRNA ligase [Mesoplasma lactucae ATCC 49193]ATZ19977.1 tyrosyl-tRNA synthetase [Mesoplasma lactucae ATCC 49193]MCL8217072.1 Tyrosine--tRNA ligase [Mesoplasma lactucae ATCC 49193]